MRTARRVIHRSGELKSAGSLRKVKATLTLLLLSLMLWAGYAMGMEYAYALGRAGHNEAALALGLAGVFVCAPFTFLASAACGVAGAL
jgi:hypothetical protein